MEPNDPDHYDSRAEEAIDWYEHYMSVQIEDLVAEYLSASLRDNRHVSESMRMAIQSRRNEATKHLRDAEIPDDE